MFGEARLDWHIGAFAEADIILINTCSIRGLAEEKAIGKADHLLRARREGKGAKFVGILGCMAQNRGAELLERLPDLDLIVGTQRLRHIPDYLSQLLAAPTPVACIDTAHEEGFEDALPGRDDGRQVSAYVSIQQGCDMKCAYCVVPKTRGPARSRSPESILAEVRALAESGTREVTLLGQIVNQYGRGRLRTEDVSLPTDKTFLSRRQIRPRVVVAAVLAVLELLRKRDFFQDQDCSSWRASIRFFRLLYLAACP